jgi:ABC-2 type transport system permease protein
MRNIWTIAKREYDNYFNSPLAYVVAFAILLPIGIYFSLIMFISSQQAMMGGSVPESTPINWLFVFLMIFLSPALTMRLLSDEARMGTLELLLTAPIRDFELVAGKWLGAFLFVLSVVALTLVFPITIRNFVSPGIDWGVILSSYIGVILVCAALLALGTASQPFSQINLPRSSLRLACSSSFGSWSVCRQATCRKAEMCSTTLAFQHISHSP